MSKIPFIDLKSSHALLSCAIKQRIDAVLSHGQYVNGPEIKELETALAAYTKAKHCISCSSGTDALVLALLALGIKRNDVVFVPSFTFIATASAVAQIGAIPYFVDIDPTTYTMSVASLKKAYLDAKKHHTSRAIICVDLFGVPCDYDAINHFAREESLPVIADAAQSFGGEYKNQKVGTLATISTTSFFPAKPLGCYGDGGAVFTEDPELAHRLYSLREYGKGKDRYAPVSIGINGRLDTIQAAILLEKLTLFPEELHKRKKHAAYYTQLLSTLAPLTFEDRESAWAQYTIRSQQRDKIQKKLSEENIPSMIYYKLPIHQALPYKHFPKTSLEHTEKASQEVLSLPFHPYLQKNIQDTIASCVMQETPLPCQVP